jgi:uncharacterized protein
MKSQPAILGEEFRPSERFKSLYYTYFSAAAILFVLWWLAPVALFAPVEVAAGLLAIFVPILLFAVYWIPKYYATVTYKLTREEMTWRRGVWFKNTGIVSYNRITNIDITQGPVSRYFRIASLKIQTAGYSAANARSAEIRLDGIEDFEGLREFIMQLVRGKVPVAVESYHKGASAAADDASVLTELVKIRKLLERRK